MPPFPAHVPVQAVDPLENPELSSLLHSPAPLPHMDAGTIEQCLLETTSSNLFGSALMSRLLGREDANIAAAAASDATATLLPAALPSRDPERAKRKKSHSASSALSSDAQVRGCCGVEMRGVAVHVTCLSMM